MFTARLTATNGDPAGFLCQLPEQSGGFWKLQTAVPVVGQPPTYTYFYGVGLK